MPDAVDNVAAEAHKDLDKANGAVHKAEDAKKKADGVKSEKVGLGEKLKLKCKSLSEKMKKKK